MNDTNLLQAISDGNREAFRKLYHLYSSKVYNTAIGYTQAKEGAEEVTQDVFTNVFRNAGKFKGNAAVGTWIYRITVNCALNYLKKNKRSSFLTYGEQEIQIPHFDHPGVLLENKEKAQFLFAAIDTLPHTQKTAFILSFVEGLPRQEVADIMETSLKAIESLLQRAKRNLREKLGKIYPNRRK